MPIVDVTNRPWVVEVVAENAVAEFTDEQVTVEIANGTPVVEFLAARPDATLILSPGLEGGGPVQGDVFINQDIPGLPAGSTIDPVNDLFMMWDASSNTHVKMPADFWDDGDWLTEIPWATRAETDAGVLTDKALNPDVGAYAYDRFRYWGQHAAGKATATVTLTITAAAVTADCRTSNVFRVGLTENITFNNPVNPIDGQVCNIRFKQDSPGGRTVTFGNKIKVAGTLATTANAVSILSMQYDSLDDQWEGVISSGFA